MLNIDNSKTKKFKILDSDPPRITMELDENIFGIGSCCYFDYHYISTENKYDWEMIAFYDENKKNEFNEESIIEEFVEYCKENEIEVIEKQLHYTTELVKQIREIVKQGEREMSSSCWMCSKTKYKCRCNNGENNV